MTITDERVVSTLSDLGRLSMRDMTRLSDSALDGAVQRIIPDQAVTAVPAAAFNSAI